MQFHLKTTLFVTAIVALAAFSYSQSMRMARLEDELSATRARSDDLASELKMRVSLLMQKQKEVWDLQMKVEELGDGQDVDEP